VARYEFKPEFTRQLTAQPEKVWRPEELVGFLFDTKAPFAAGKGWDYSDTNFILLGMILERVTGRSYRELLAERLLGPLRLESTMPSDRRLLPGLAQGYAGSKNAFGGRDAMLDSVGRMIINPQFEWTGGGIASTARDLARWAQALYGGRVLDTASLLNDVLP
jgi:D-alanyl-D-alanine carboxypeptidase